MKLFEIIRNINDSIHDILRESLTLKAEKYIDTIDKVTEGLTIDPKEIFDISEIQDSIKYGNELYKECIKTLNKDRQTILNLNEILDYFSKYGFDYE